MKTINIQEDWGIKKVGEFYREVTRAMENETGCVLDFSEVHRVDLSAAQVVLALRHDCEQNGGKCEIRNANEETARLLSYAGIQRDECGSSITSAPSPGGRGEEVS